MSAQPGIICDWNLSKLTVADIENGTKEAIKKIKEKIDQIGKLKPEEISLKSCIKPLVELERLYSLSTRPLTFAHECGVADPNVRRASVEASKRLSELLVEVAMRKDVFDNVCTFRDKMADADELDEPELTLELRRFVEREVTNGKRNGLHLSEEIRQEVKEVKKRISELGTNFRSNLNEDITTLELSEEELLGVPEDLIRSFDRTPGGLYRVTMKYPHYLPVTRRCRVPETRRKMETAYNSRCLEENTKLLEELIRLRQKQADLLGYNNHAAYVQEILMADGPETVSNFLSDLADRLQPIWKKEREVMIALKEEECDKYGYPFSGTLNFWDIRYYNTRVEEKLYSVDQEELKEYFPLETVTRGMLDIYQSLLGLVFTECRNAQAWHEEVKLFRVDDTSTSDTLGYFFMDLHPREGKYGHAAIFGLQPSCLATDGNRQVGVCAMMCNFSRPTSEDRPSLLNHGEVRTYFHEFGHVMHKLCALTDTARFSGTAVERDFVEAPSQMLENWVWEEQALRKMSGHYKTGSPLPGNLLAKLMSSRRANAGGFNLRQIILGTFDQRIHTRNGADEAVDTRALFTQTYKEVLGIDTIQGTNMPASFGHIAGGYDAQYYGYLWSEVFSFDMYETRFKEEGLLNPQVGLDYRRQILQPGGSKDAKDMLADFLGRPPNNEAFLKAKGL